MKKIAIFVLLLFLASGLYADDKRFKAFQLSYVGLDYIDVSTTLYGLELGKKEGNPLTRLYIKKPTLTFAVHTVLNFATIKLTDALYKKNKKLAWVFIIGMNMIKAYIVYRNIKILFL